MRASADLRMVGRAVDSRAVRAVRDHTVNHGRGRVHGDCGSSVVGKSCVRDGGALCENRWEVLKVKERQVQVLFWEEAGAPLSWSAPFSARRRCIALPSKHVR